MNTEKEFVPVTPENIDARREEILIEKTASIISARINLLKDQDTKVELLKVLDDFKQNPQGGAQLLQLKLRRLAERVAPLGSEDDQLQYQKMFNSFQSTLGPLVAQWKATRAAESAALRKRSFTESIEGDLAKAAKRRPPPPPAPSQNPTL